MKNVMATGQVSGQVEAHDAQVMPPVVGQPEWSSKGGRTFLSAKGSVGKGVGTFQSPASLMAGWKTRPPVIEAVAWKTDKARKEISEEIWV